MSLTEFNQWSQGEGPSVEEDEETVSVCSRRPEVVTGSMRYCIEY